MAEIDTTSLGIEVEPSKISKELHKLWATDKARTNASLMNFAIFSEDPTMLQRNSDRIQTLSSDHACRALSIVLDRNAPEPSIKSWVTAHCHMANGKKTVCCEQVSFFLKGIAPGRLRNTVFANLNSDLPLVLWWQGELSDAFEPKLYSLIDRLIYDSSSWTSAKEGYDRILDAIDQSPRKLITQDLAWTRSFNFRLAFAALFDDVVAQGDFENINALKIKAAPQRRSTALFLLSWVATQAEYTFLSKDGDEFHFESKNGVKITATLEFGGDRCLTLLEASSETGIYRVSQSDNPNLLDHFIDTPHHKWTSISPAPPIKARELVADQLSRGGKNSLMRKVLPLFLKLI